MKSDQFIWWYLEFCLLYFGNHFNKTNAKHVKWKYPTSKTKAEELLNIATPAGLAGRTRWSRWKQCWSQSWQRLWNRILNEKNWKDHNFFILTSIQLLLTLRAQQVGTRLAFTRIGACIFGCPLENFESSCCMLLTPAPRSSNCNRYLELKIIPWY